jgi:hypothetical protein
MTRRAREIVSEVLERRIVNGAAAHALIQLDRLEAGGTKLARGGASKYPQTNMPRKPLTKLDSQTEMDLDFLPPGLDFLPPDLEILPPDLEILPDNLDFLPEPGRPKGVSCPS